MVHPELLKYVQAQLNKGTPVYSIRTTLLNIGWPSEEVDKAISVASLNLKQPPAPSTQLQVKSSPTEKTKVKRSLFQKWAGALAHPTQTFKEEKSNATLGYGAKSILVSGLIGGLILGIAMFVNIGNTLGILGPFAGLFSGVLGFFFLIILLIITPISVILSWLIGSGFLYVVAKAFSGKGTYTKQSYIISLYSAPIFVISAILRSLPTPANITFLTFTISEWLGILIGVFALYFLTLALREVHEYSTIKSVITWLIPQLLFLGLAIMGTKFLLVNLLYLGL